MNLIKIKIKELELELPSEIKNSKGETPNIRNLGEYLVWKFIKYPNSLSSKEWVREKGIAKRILAKYPDPKFWNDVIIDFYLNSLAFFLTYKGKELLYKEQNKFKLDFVLN